MPIDQFKKEMEEFGVASANTQSNALAELIQKIETMDAELMKLEEEKDGEVASLSAKLEDLENDHSETKDIVVALNRDLNNVLPPGE